MPCTEHVFALACLLLLAACNSNDGSECHNLQNSAAAISNTNLSGPPPAHTSGTITNGTYELTAVNVYPGESANTFRETIRITGNSMQNVWDSGGQDGRNTWTFAVDAASGTMSWRVSCQGDSGPDESVYTYSATPDRLTHYITTADKTRELVWDRVQ